MSGHMNANQKHRLQSKNLAQIDNHSPKKVKLCLRFLLLHLFLHVSIKFIHGQSS